MSYNIRVDRIAQDISDEVRDAVLKFLPSYEFPYVTAVTERKALQQLFIEHFQNRHDLAWLKAKIYGLTVMRDRRASTAIALSETNRLHTKGLGTVLLSNGQTKCRTIHSYGKESSMNSKCWRNLKGKTFDIKTIIANSFPESRADLENDIPMIPQHINCRHVMAPLE